MHVLVTGCAGFIGSTVVDALLARGDGVRGVDSFNDYYDPAQKRSNIGSAEHHQGFELVETDLLTCDIAELLDGVEIVIHEAGQPGVRVSWADGFTTYVERNVLVTQRLLEAVREQPVERVVYASSSSVYGNAARYPTTEADLPRPHSPYGVTKLAAEHLCSLYAENWRVPTVSLRYFSVYGPRQRPDMGFSRFLRAALAGDALPIYGDGTQIRDFTYVCDIVDATIAAAEANTDPGVVCNVAGGSNISVNELIELLTDLLGHSIAVTHLPPQPGDVRQTGGSVEAALRLLDWKPSTSLRDGIAAQLQWTRDQVDRGS